MKKRLLLQSLALLLALLLSLCACIPSSLPQENDKTQAPTAETTAQAPSQFDLSNLPAYSGTPYVALNNNVPSFTSDQYVTTSYELYSELDSLRRCGVAIACIGVDLMPTEERESISSVKPSGWQSVQYDIVDGKYLYNRCHLIGFQLSGENANNKNLITGTRYMNVDGMLPFENMVADYVKETKNHVLFRVTPIFYGNELVARGVQMEAYSVEDHGDGICFNVFVYNVQPGITIDYMTGKSHLTQGSATAGATTAQDVQGTYTLNTNSQKFHKPSCSYAASINEANKQTYTGSRQALIDQGYTPCGSCKP